MKISVRFAVAAMCTAAVIVCSVVIIAISSVYSHNTAVELGQDHARSLSEIALLKTERYFDEMAAHARQMQILAKRDGFKLPRDDPDPLWYKKWHQLMEAPLIGSNYSYVHIFGVFFDESLVRCKVLPRGKGLTGRVLSSYIYNPWHKPVAEEHQYYLGNQSVVPIWNKEHYPFPNINGTRFPFYRLGTFWSGNNTPDTAYWLNVGMVAFPSEVVMPTGVPLHNSTGHFMGHIYVVRTFTQTNNFLLSTVSNFKGVKGFIVDQDGLMVGTTEAQPTFTQSIHPSRGNLSVDKFCAVSPPTDPVVTLTCRTHIDNYTFTGLRDEFYRLQGEALPRNSISDRKYQGEGYFVVASDVENIHPVNFKLRLFLFYPKKNVLRTVENSRAITIGLGAAVAVVSAILAIVGIHLLLRPMSALAGEMKLIGSLRTSGRKFNESAFSEVYALQLAFLDMHAKLHDLKRFVPHGLLSRVEDHEASTTTPGESLPELPFSEPETSPIYTGSGTELFSASLTDSVRSLGLSKKKLRGETNVFYRKKCTILSLEISNLPDDAESLRVACDSVLYVFVEEVVAFGGVIDRLTPHKSTATFNAHQPCVMHERRSFECAKHMARQLKDTPYAFSIALDSSQHYVGTAGHVMHSALSIFGEGYELVDRLHNMASTYINSPILLTERVIAELSPKTFVPVDILAPRWIQETRKRTFVLYEPADIPCTDGIRTIFSQVLGGDFKKALQGIAKEKESVAEYEPVLARLKIACETCVERKYPAYARCEVPFFDNLGNKVAEGPQTVKLHHRGVVESGEVVGAIREAMARNQPTIYEEEGLFGMYVPVQKLASPTSPEGEETELPRSMVDHQKRRWRRCDDVIGTGAFSVVHKGIGERGQFCAMKFRRITPDTQIEDLANELEMISKLSHENLVVYYSCSTTKHSLVLIMEYVSSGTLSTLSRAFGGIPVELLKRNARDVLTGLAFLHKHGVIHCDLKPENVLVSVDGVCKLCDFGSAIAQHMSCSSYLHVRGTAAYMAPEVALGHSPTERSDVWSFGVTILEVAAGQPPWPSMPGGATAEAKFIEAISKDERMVPQIPSCLHQEKDLCNLLKLCLQRDQNERPSVEQLLASPYFI